jgi:hypothetical protein
MIMPVMKDKRIYHKQMADRQALGWDTAKYTTRIGGLRDVGSDF